MIGAWSIGLVPYLAELHVELHDFECAHGAYDAIAIATCKPLCLKPPFVSRGNKWVEIPLSTFYFLRSRVSNSSAGTGGLVR
jgi:hypothetical protein